MKKSLYFNNNVCVFDQFDHRKRDKYFELARKLYISNIPTEFFNVDSLDERFRVYGSIESIELHTDKYFVADHLSKYPNYAYVTFSELSSAQKALNAKTLKKPLKKTDIKTDSKTGFYIEPANTWKQPTDPETFEPTENDYFSSLNEHCLLKLLSYLREEDLFELAQVSRHFHTLIHDKVFKRTRELSWSSSALQLAHFRQTILAYGKYVEKITIYFPRSPIEQIFIPRMIDILTKYVGDNLVVLKIHNLIITDRINLQFKKLFERLRVLKWYCSYEYRYEQLSRYYGYYEYRDLRFPSATYSQCDVRDTDLINACVNLEQLTVTQKHEFLVNSGAWQKLKKIHIGFRGFFKNGRYPDFFRNNPQLTHLKILAEYDSGALLNDIVTYLPNLEKLNIYCITVEEDNDIEKLMSLQNLRVLKLRAVHSRVMNRLLEIASTLPNLEEVVLRTYGLQYGIIPDFSSLREFVENSEKLRIFCLDQYVLTEDIIIDVIRYNKNLEFFGFYFCVVAMSSKLLMDMCDARKNSPKGETGPLQIGVEYYDDVELDNLSKSNEVLKYIKLVNDRV